MIVNIACNTSPRTYFDVMGRLPARAPSAARESMLAVGAKRSGAGGSGNGSGRGGDGSGDGPSAADQRSDKEAGGEAVDRAGASAGSGVGSSRKRRKRDKRSLQARLNAMRYSCVLHFPRNSSSRRCTKLVFAPPRRTIAGRKQRCLDRV